MDVDGGAKGKGKHKCYECGEDMHFARDYPIRKQRIAAGGPAIFRNNPNGKGGGKGQGTWIPSVVQCKSMYPGPSPTMWQSWRPQTPPSAAAKGGGKANLFQIPNQLSALQQLFGFQSGLQIAPHNFGRAYSPVLKMRRVQTK